MKSFSQRKPVFVGLVVSVAMLTVLSTVRPARPADAPDLTRIRQQIDHGAVLLNDESGKRLISINAAEPFVPASTIKVLTSMVALDTLGEDYRFPTEIYEDASGNIAVKGYGDPYLVSDELRQIAVRLRQLGRTSVNKLYLDSSYFAPGLSIPGVSGTDNPYDALNGALAVNFNSVHLKRDASGTVFSGEQETPLTPLARRVAQGVPPGFDDRINLSAQPSVCRQYAGELISAIFMEQGMRFNDPEVGETRVGPSWRLIYTHRNSRPLSEVVRGLLRYSNNFIANQIFLAMGAADAGAPATLSKGKQVVDRYVRDTLLISPNELTVWEGSGISRQTTVTGNAMMRIMERFRPKAHLLTPRIGHPAKGGTLTGVYSLVGYIETDSGLRPFVILLNQKRNNRNALLKLLADVPG